VKKILVLFVSMILAFSVLGGDFKKEKQRVYDELQLIMTAKEQKEFKKIKTEKELEKFVEEFWKKRDPDPSTPENEVKELYYKRMKETKRFFREPGRKPWLTERGKVYMILGRPMSWERKLMQKGTIANQEMWRYDRFQLTIYFVDRSNTGRYYLQQPPSKLLDLMGQEKKFFLPQSKSSSLTIKAYIDRATGKLYIHIPLSGLTFVKKDGKFYTNFNFSFAYGHPQDPQPKEFTQKMSVPVSEKDIKAGDKQITIPVNIAPLKGQYIFIVEVEDLISGKKITKTYKVRL